MAVDVVDRHDEERRGGEQLAPPAECEVAQQHQRSVLAIDLAGMNPVLDHHHRLRERLRRRRSERPLGGEDHHRHRPARGRVAVELELHLGESALELAQEGEGLVVRGRRLEVGFLCRRQPHLGDRIRRVRDCGQREDLARKAKKKRTSKGNALRSTRGRCGSDLLPAPSADAAAPGAPGLIRVRPPWRSRGRRRRRR